LKLEKFDLGFIELMVFIGAESINPMSSKDLMNKERIRGPR
jgi:hypothetical protein